MDRTLADALAALACLAVVAAVTGWATVLGGL